MNIVVDPPELHTAAQTLKELSEEYSTIYQRLINTASTMGEAWKGADNLAYVERINGFCDELKAMTAHLMQCSTALDKQASTYEGIIDINITGVQQLAN